jgi:uncharacterized membrane protein YqjE
VATGLNVTTQDASDRRPARESDKGVIDIAGEAFKDIGLLVQTEFQLLRAEISEKLAVSALAAALIAAGAVLLMATIVLLLQAGIAALVASGLSWPVAILLVAAASLLAGAGLVWFGTSNLRPKRLAPSKTIAQLQKDADLATKE